jgi:two-component system, cell cycle sensor histidine kinase and response regulator CckA
MKILVVDDHPVILRMMSSLLGKEGHLVRTASDGLSALDILETWTPNVIFIDLVMPNIGGEKLCKIIRSRPRLKDIYVIIFSDIAIENQKCVTEYGANACISKGPGASQHIFAALDEYVFQKSEQALFSRLEDPLFQLDLEKSNGGPKPVMGADERSSRQISQQLISSRRHLEVILNVLPFAIMEATLEGRVTVVNPAAVLLTGIAEESLLGSDVVGLFIEHAHEIIKANILAVHESEQGTTIHGTTLRNGKCISLDVLPIEDEDNRSVLLVLREQGQ